MNSGPNAETFRVKTLIHLVAKDLAQARLEIQKALELGPRWESVRFTAAVIDYFSSLSPAILPGRLVAWPGPVDWTYVKRDPESIMRLRRAAMIFQELSGEEEKPEEERQRLMAWRLACLANDGEKQEEAIQYCQEVLLAYPTHYPAIVWAVARNFDIDLSPTEAALEKLVGNEPVAIPCVLGLINCYLASGKATKAIDLLAKTKSVFEDHNEKPLWDFWHVQSLVSSGDINEARQAVDAAKAQADLRPARAVVLGALSQQTGDWELLTKHLESSYRETGNPDFLFRSCSLMAQQQEWEYVADRAELLVEEFGTGEALRLATIAAHNAGRFALSLRLLDENQELFGQKLPIELRRIRISCQRNLGILPEAITEAEILALEESTVDNLLNLAQLYFDKGDLRGVTIVAQKLVDHPNLDSESSLRIARLVQWEDMGLSTSLWRKAIREDIPDFLVGDALALGYQLGLDREVRPLLSRMMELGQQGIGGIQMATVQDLMTHAKQHQEHVAELNEVYQNGMSPVHLIAEQLNWPLAELYHGSLKEHEAIPDPIRQPSLLIRHGGRGLVQGFPEEIPEWRLNLDITSLLLAAHLEILDQVEEAFKPLCIPAPVMPALLQMRERLAHHQPSRIETCQQIVGLVDSGSLKVLDCPVPPDYPNADLVSELGEEFVACFERARTDDAYVVCFLPLRRRDLMGPPSGLSEEAKQYLVNCRGIAEALREYGPLPATEYTNALEELGEEGLKIGNEIVPEGESTLYCLGNIPEVLAGAGLLKTACERFEVHIGRREFERVCAELKETERRSAIGHWIEGLANRISRGIDDKTYEIIPTVSAKETSKEPFTEPPDVDCLLTLLKFDAQEGDVIWADDRYMNSYLRRDAIPIIGISEILKALVSLDALKADEYYSKISQLRAGNTRFVPVQSDEILYHLRQAKIENHEIIETTNLSILRRYVAACLLQNEVLQQPPLPRSAPNPDGEIAFILNLARAVSEAIIGLWLDEAISEEDRLACAEWILSSLYLNHLGLRNLTSLSTPDQDEQYLVAISLVGLLSQAIALGPSRNAEERTARRSYFDWLFNRVLRRRFNADPHLLETVVELLKSLLAAQESTMSNQDIGPSALMWFLQAFYEDLPEPIQDEMWLDTDLMAKIGIRPMYAITVGDLSFAPDDFFRAASEAVNGRRATVTAINVDEEVTFEACSDPSTPGAFCFEYPETGERQAFVNQDLELLLDSPTGREALLRRNRHWFDCSEDMFNQAVAEIVSTEDPRRRVEEVREWRGQSAAVFYDELYRDLEEQKAFGFDDLRPPSAEGLPRHLRLHPTVGTGAECREALSVAAQALVREEGLLPAINRLVGLPVPLPATLVEAVANLPAGDRRTLIKRLVRTAGSPVSKVHLVRLLLVSGDETTAFWRLAQRIIRGLLSPEGVVEFGTFLAILRWVSDEFSQRSDMQTWSAHLRLALAWVHTHRLFVTFAYLGIPANWLNDVFGQANLRLPPEAFERDPKYWFDVSHPQRVSYVTFLISGLAYGLDERGAQFVDGGLRALLEALTFREVEGRRVPVPALMRDYTQAGNSLSSFLGGDLGDKSSMLLSTEDADVIKQSSLQALVEESVRVVAGEGDEFSGWSLIYAVLGGFPPYEDLADRLGSLIRQTNFVDLFERNVPAGNFAILTASLQTVHLGDEEVRLYLKDQLTGMARLFASWESGEVNCSAVGKDEFGRSQDLCASLIESALNVAVAAQPPQDVIAEFADLLAKLVEIWHSVIPACKPIVQVLSEELPIADAKRFWPLLVRLRAE